MQSYHKFCMEVVDVKYYNKSRWVYHATPKDRELKFRCAFQKVLYKAIYKKLSHLGKIFYDAI